MTRRFPPLAVCALLAAACVGPRYPGEADDANPVELVIAQGGPPAVTEETSVTPAAPAPAAPAAVPAAETAAPAAAAPAAVDPAAAQAAAQAAAAKEAAALAAAMQQVSKAKTDYRLAAADLVSITVYQDPEMSRKVRINVNGTVSMPLVGPVKIGGLTLLEAQAALEGRLARYVVNPQISLFIEEYGNKSIFVMGEVQKPGSYPIPTESRMTVLEAISTAGGFTAIAAQDRTRVLRNVGGVNHTFNVNVRAITQQGQKDQDLVLEPNDVVYVPQSFF